MIIHFLSAERLACQVCLKKAEIDLKLLTYTNSRKKIRGKVCHAIHRYAKANVQYMKDYKRTQRIIIFNVLGCEQFLWLTNFSLLKPVYNFE